MREGHPGIAYLQGYLEALARDVGMRRRQELDEGMSCLASASVFLSVIFIGSSSASVPEVVGLALQ